MKVYDKKPKWVGFPVEDDFKKMGKGGKVSKLFKGKETYAEELAEAKAVKSGRISPKQYAEEESKEKKAAGGVCKGAGAATRGTRFIGVR